MKKDNQWPQFKSNSPVLENTKSFSYQLIPEVYRLLLGLALLLGWIGLVKSPTIDLSQTAVVVSGLWVLILWGGTRKFRRSVMIAPDQIIDQVTAGKTSLWSLKLPMDGISSVRSVRSFLRVWSVEVATVDGAARRLFHSGRDDVDRFRDLIQAARAKPIEQLVNRETLPGPSKGGKVTLSIYRVGAEILATGALSATTGLKGLAGLMGAVEAHMRIVEE